ncbi:uncharacterized protein LOC142784443 [Rhipicephalus microplus]|uniref:uncharacterized protein LOC142784443 n=1 Tax=Rhipicephalus microplus TaxID=6941 RepID=UPI003F6CD144
MTRVLVAGDSMVKYVDQYFPSRRGLSVSVAAHRGIRIEHLLSMIADKLASFDVVIVHVGTNNTVDSVNMCMDKYRQLAQGIIESNPMLHVAFSAILPRGQNRYCQGEEQLCDVCHLNDHYRNVDAALAQLCLERGFTILDSLVDSWPRFLSRDGVHPSRLGNKVLADFLHREACALSTHLERRHIQQSYKESKASAWSGWARQEHFSINLEFDFPALGMHAVQYSPAVGGPSAAPAPVWETSSALMQRHDTDQLASTIHGIGFTLVGGVCVRCKGSKAWWTWDSLPSPIFHGTSVPCKGNTGERPIQPMIPSRGASTTCDRKIRRASQEHESALVRSSVGEEEASAGKAALPQAVGQCGDSEWKLVQSKKSRRKAAALHKQEQSSKLCADSEEKVLAVTAAKSIRSTSPMTAVVSQKQIQSASSAVCGRKPEGRASVSHNVIRDSFKKVQRVPSKQLKDCSVSSATHCESVTNDAVNEVSVCKSHLPALTRDGMRIERDPGTEAGDPVEAGCTAAVQYKYCEAALTSRSRPVSPGAQAICVNTGANPTVLNNPVSTLYGGGSKVYLNATFDNFPSFNKSFDEWCREGRHVVMINKSNKSPFTSEDKDFEYIRIKYSCIHGRTIKPRGIGKRPKQAYNGTGCEMTVPVSLCKSPTLHYKITKLQAKHNHPTEYYDLYPQKRLLNHGEKEFFDLAKCNIGAKDFKNLVEQKTGKKLTTKDINNYKQRFSIPIRNEQAHGEMVLEKVETLLKNNPNWVIHYEMNQNNNLQFILLQTTHMREILEKYPEILFIDGTYKVNIEGYILYSILVQDGCGRGRPVCYAFLRNETTEIVEPMFTKFVDFNPFVVSACKVVMIDKDLNELRILTSILPNSNILLCTWHVLHCFQQKVNEKARQQRDQLHPLLKSLVYSPTEQDYFDKLANLQAMTCTDFISYYMHNWHLCKEMWVHAYRQALPTFGNNTNNRIECHNQKIKNYLSSSMHLVQAIEALVGYIDNDSLSLQFSKLK